MGRQRLTASESKTIDACLGQFQRDEQHYVRFAEGLLEAFADNTILRRYIHSTRMRVKSVERLERKLKRVMLKGRRTAGPLVNTQNVHLFVKDYVGIRVLHIHMEQYREMKGIIDDILANEKIAIMEGPIAHVWDIEYRSFFGDLRVKVEERKSMYTSVHYALKPKKASPVTIELQVRTLSEELWGETSHALAYEDDQPAEHILDQLRVLARLTSGSTRLVDSLVKQHRQAKKQ
ncbi:MAG: hypothetical protein D8M59_15305 [Planctomycetes bacterium]|nr:hypothetical protein [Planctomycetota bacterium]NOG55335.1 hypothetical protein [Planctomycetota bacterium]